ncbi:MAG: site-specific DNA-methyltransferase [Methanobrevibacter sp.]|jgi:adenine-specific DNA-methyltransferase|nr:site-specific DNA-methyltransferase [Candidatus Methanovirga meridionalis]
MEEVKYEGKSLNIVEENKKRLKEIFPQIVTDGKIDFEELKQLLGKDIEDKTEKYGFNWYGKSEAEKYAYEESTGTLRPCKEESKNWDETENLYIEGDNLEVLKILQNSYRNKIKMIYIDPPYNTGKDFIYKDNFKDNLKNYQEITNQVDEEGKSLSTNTEGTGRFHTNWLNMMYPRLILARKLLTDDGVIFISIDDNEVSNLKKICDEIFGEENLVTILTIKTGGPGGFKTKANKPVKVKEFILLYSKNIIHYNYIPAYVKKMGMWDTHFNSFYDHENNKFYPLIDILKEKDIIDNNTKLGDLSLTHKKFKEFYLTNTNNIFDTKYYKESPEKTKSINNKNKVIIYQREDGRKLYFLNGRLMNFLETSYKPVDSIGTKTIATPLSDIWEDIPYNNIQNESDIPTFKSGQKPLNLIKRMLIMTNTKNTIILDFFSGSSTTAHAVIDLNNDDDENRKFIMVQLPEQIDPKSEVYKAGYKNITDIGKERIRRAGDKILSESDNKDLDIGFKVFKLDSSNLIKWNDNPDEIHKTIESYGKDNIVYGRNDYDLIFGFLLDEGLNLNSKIEKRVLGSGKTVYSVENGILFFCFDDEIMNDISNELIELKNEFDTKPIIVFKDNSLTDSDKANLKENLSSNGFAKFVTI